MFVINQLSHIYMQLCIHTCTCRVYIIVACQQQSCWAEIKSTSLVSTASQKRPCRATDGHCHAGNCSRGKLALFRLQLDTDYAYISSRSVLILLLLLLSHITSTASLCICLCVSVSVCLSYRWASTAKTAERIVMPFSFFGGGGQIWGKCC